METIRIRKIAIDNFRAIGHGSISINRSESQDSPEILALYGANGTGKSSLVDALRFIRSIMILDNGFSYVGNFMQDISSSIIRDSHESATLYLELEDLSDDDSCNIEYSVDLLRNGNSLVLSNEMLKLKKEGAFTYSLKTGRKPSRYLIDNIVETCLIPDIDRRAASSDLYSKRCDSSDIHSLFFLMGFEYWDDIGKTEPGLIIKKLLLFFQNQQIFSDYDWQSLRLRSFPYIQELHLTPNVASSNAKLYIPPNSSQIFNLNKALECNDYADALARQIDRCNAFLRCISNDFQLQLERIDNNGVEELHLYSKNSDGGKIPFIRESYGRMKILHMMTSLSRFLDEPSFCLIIDEFDEGLFEFLFGELLTVLKEYGEGQLIYTAHNLISAERLENVELCFTTQDMDNRFKRIPDVKNENNLRKIYFKEIKGMRNGSSFHMEIDKDKISEALTYDFGPHIMD